MAINVSVAGYGNLGKQLVEQIRLDEKFALKYVFSRRNIDVAERQPFEKAECLHRETDILLLALGSYNDLRQNLNYFKSYDTVDCFDTHDKMNEYRALLCKTKPDTFSLYAAGWDPGILSISRGLFSCLGNTTTLWGKGQSMGHGNAIRNINGVLDAVQFTCPLPDAEFRFAEGENNPKKLIKRICYVAAVSAYKHRIEQEILTMPDYFEGYTTEVHFVEKSQVKLLHNDMSHKGKVFMFGKGWQASTDVSMQNNAAFTARIMLQCALGAEKCKEDCLKGVFSLFDLPLRYFVDTTCL